MVLRVLSNDVSESFYDKAFRAFFSLISASQAGFKMETWDAIDFSEAQLNGLQSALRWYLNTKDWSAEWIVKWMQKVIQGCLVHFQRSVERVINWNCKNADEEAEFKRLAYAIPYLDTVAQRDAHYAQITARWSDLKPWAAWWQRPKIDSILAWSTKGKTMEEWLAAPTDSNAIEGHNSEAKRKKLLRYARQLLHWARTDIQTARQVDAVENLNGVVAPRFLVNASQQRAPRKRDRDRDGGHDSRAPDTRAATTAAAKRKAPRKYTAPNAGDVPPTPAEGAVAVPPSESTSTPNTSTEAASAPIAALAEPATEFARQTSTPHPDAAMHSAPSTSPALPGTPANAPLSAPNVVVSSDLQGRQFGTLMMAVGNTQRPPAVDAWKEKLPIKVGGVIAVEGESGKKTKLWFAMATEESANGNVQVKWLNKANNGMWNVQQKQIVNIEPDNIVDVGVEATCPCGSGIGCSCTAVLIKTTEVNRCEQLLAGRPKR